VDLETKTTGGWKVLSRICGPFVPTHGESGGWAIMEAQFELKVDSGTLKGQKVTRTSSFK
jgi:hypothetical protein